MPLVQSLDILRSRLSNPVFKSVLDDGKADYSAEVAALGGTVTYAHAEVGFAIVSGLGDEAATELECLKRLRQWWTFLQRSLNAVPDDDGQRPAGLQLHDRLDVGVGHDQRSVRRGGVGRLRRVGDLEFVLVERAKNIQRDRGPVRRDRSPQRHPPRR